MPHQVALSIRTPIKPGHTEALEQIFASMREDVEDNEVLPFAKLTGVHFARYAVIPGETDLSGEPVGPTLVWASNVDAPLDAHLDDLVAVGGPGLDAIYEHCEGYPDPPDRTPATRSAYLRAHMIPTQAYYVNTVGRSLAQVRRETILRERIEDFLDDLRSEPDWADQGRDDVREAILRFVAGDPGLRWALQPAPRPSSSWRRKERGRFALILLLGVLLLPFLIIAIPIALLALRFKERQDLRTETIPRRFGSRAALAGREDQVAQNQFSAVGRLKPGPIRYAAAYVILRSAGVATRHVFTNGDLGTVKPLGLDGVDTIHFARWVSIDGGRRVFFMSNYDGSLESYMDDFINKVAWGLNAVFTHGRTYPPTRWLVFDGAKDEQAFKAFLRRHQLPTGVWYSGVENLTAVNIANNAAIREGLTRHLDPVELERWLRRF